MSEQTAEKDAGRAAMQHNIREALEMRAKHGRHLHHSACIHNLPPEEQVEARGKTVEWWTAYIGDLPTQITPDQWETDPPDFRPIPPAKGERP